MMSVLKNDRGMALLFAMTIVVLVIAIVKDLAFDSIVEYSISTRSYTQLKAYYAAKSGAEISILRLHIYRKAIAQFGAQLGANKSMLDPIWQFPFSWPPPIPEEISKVNKDQIGKTIKESIMDVQYLATIESEGAKIDINDLASPVKSLADTTKQQLLQIFAWEQESNEQFSSQYRNFDFEQLINNIADWVDADTESRNGGDEASLYREITDISLPPNRPLKTIEELHMIATLSDEIFRVLAPRVTVFGSKGINVNYASKEVLMSLAPEFNEEVADAVKKRIETPEEGGPFKDEADFQSFVENLGVNYSKIKDSGMPLLFDAEFNFRIRSTGQYQNSASEIVAIVYDFDKVRGRVTDFLKKQLEDEKKQSGDQTTPDEDTDKMPQTSPNGEDPTKKAAETTPPPAPSGRPNVVYWMETT
jgi:general secretion pathway protein K